MEHDLTLWYELVELPFLKAVKLLKFSYENEILLLGNDQSIYAIADDDRTEIVPIFNADEHIVSILSLRDWRDSM